MMLKIIISCDDLIFQMVLGPFDLNLNSKQWASREGVDEMFHLHLSSPRPQTWHSLFLSIAKGFEVFTSFLSSPKMGVLVQSVFEFQKDSTFYLLQKCPNHFWKLG